MSLLIEKLQQTTSVFISRLWTVWFYRVCEKTPYFDSTGCPRRHHNLILQDVREDAILWFYRFSERTPYFDSVGCPRRHLTLILQDVREDIILWFYRFTEKHCALLTYHIDLFRACRVPWYTVIPKLWRVAQLSASACTRRHFTRHAAYT